MKQENNITSNIFLMLILIKINKPKIINKTNLKPIKPDFTALNYFKLFYF